ncbi:putative FAD-linked oxidase [Gordonia soli NBRC 108243]|uniref:Putative FAD-linked oxidase n=2 Tax=Gordonia soli TaxID=320799 RepID=M0QJD7_9ACTN|nr:putative FAD-linked oxidase [Gordonia soli NBRC 108243]
MGETALPQVEMVRPRWGDPSHAAELPDAARALAPEAGGPGSGVTPDEVSVPTPTVSDEMRRAVADIVGAEHVDDSHRDRVQHTRGYSTPDLLRLRAGDGADAPDLVVYPGDHDEVVRVLRICAEHRVAVVPFTGGTSVVGGLTPDRRQVTGVITVDVRRLDRVESVDEVSRVATLQAGLRGVRAEELLAERGFTIGHFPQSYEGAGIGGYAATRSAGQSSAGYGRFDEMVEGLVLATPKGTIELGTAPRSAAGPDLRQLILGSEGVLGIITAVTVRISPLPRRRLFDGWRFPDFASGLDAIRALAQDGPRPTVVRLSDELETALNLADPDQLGAESPGCLMVVGVEGADEAEVGRRHDAVAQALTAAGGSGPDLDAGEAWRAGRFRAPYLRDPLLDAGVLVETLETVTYWSRIEQLKAAVTGALTDALTAQGTPPLVLCHVSHVYAAGASLYFTVVAPQTEDPVAQWTAAKQAANEAIRASGASITHHHAVGRDHRAVYHAEIGELALEVLRAVKSTLDPHGVCNPGVLV